MRTLVDIPDPDLRRLDELARRSNRSRAAIIRDAIAGHLAKVDDKDWIDAAFGLWADRDDIGDGVEYQRRLRAEWDREWDPN